MNSTNSIALVVGAVILVVVAVGGGSYVVITKRKKKLHWLKSATKRMKNPISPTNKKHGGNNPPA